MAINVGVSGVTAKAVVVVGSRTIVKKVSVGTPVKRVQASAGSVLLQNIIGIDATNKENGSVLVYNSTSGNFEATRNLELQNINGGQY